MRLTMSRYLIAFLLLFSILFDVFSQNTWDDWDNNYTKISVGELLRYEKSYADSVKQGLIQGKNYSRIEAFRFYGTYQGEVQKIDLQSLNSMKNVVSIHKGDLSVFDKLQNCYLFKIEGHLVWIPIQFELEEDFRSEVKRNERIMLYCAFMNEYSETDGLQNNFLLSEFRK